jgi:pimeloyl-ACP methyl ester carboxylesterase
MSFLKTKREVPISIDSITLSGILRLPSDTRSLAIFAHGSGSSRLSPRNNFVAETLHEAGVGTLLFDLLTEQEDLIYENRFNIDLITERLVKTTESFAQLPETRELAMGYFGASTGAAAALKAAASLKSKIKAVVSRGGRVDMAADVLPDVKAPTLLIVGEDDLQVLALNREAHEMFSDVSEVHVVPGASHLFEEPGALEEVARLAAKWFNMHLK